MRRLCALVCLWTLLAALLCGCSDADGAGGLDMAKAQPLLNAAAEATAASAGGAGFEGQPSASFFTDMVTAALRDGALTTQNSLVTSGGDVYIVHDADKQTLYELFCTVGVHPGWSGSGVSLRTDSAALTVPARHPLMPKMRFEVTGVSPSADYENGYTLTALLQGDNELTGSVEYGRYTVTVLPDENSPFGCTLYAIRVQTSILAPSSGTAQTASPGSLPVVPLPTSPPQEPSDELSAFFGYAAVDALEDWTPILRSTADSCLQLEYNLEGAPDAPMLWTVVSGVVCTMGSQLPGVSVSESGYGMIDDDMTLTMTNLFAQTPQTVPEIPDQCADWVTAQNGGYTFAQRQVASFSIAQYQMQDGNAVFTMRDDQNHRVNVTLCKNELSGYGVSIASAVILP